MDPGSRLANPAGLIVDEDVEYERLPTRLPRNHPGRVRAVESGGGVNRAPVDGYGKGDAAAKALAPDTGGVKGRIQHIG